MIKQTVAWCLVAIQGLGLAQVGPLLLPASACAAESSEACCGCCTSNAYAPQSKEGECCAGTRSQEPSRPVKKSCCGRNSSEQDPVEETGLRGICRCMISSSLPVEVATPTRHFAPQSSQRQAFVSSTLETAIADPSRTYQQYSLGMNRSIWSGTLILPVLCVWRN